MGVMTPAEMKQKRALLGWTQTQLARALGVHKITVAKWETGAWPILTMTELAVNYLVLTNGRRRAKGV